MTLRSARLAPIVVLAMTACSRTPSSDGAAKSAPPPSAAPAPAAKPSASVAASESDDVLKTESGDVRITPLHHASLRLDFAGKTVYVDPDKEVDTAGLPKAAAIFITDIHPDHLVPDKITALSNDETVIIAPPAVAEKLPKSLTHVTVMKNGDVTTTKAAAVPAIPSLGVEAIPMYNEKRGPAPGKLYHDKGRGNGYVLSFGGKRIYISGDTECTPEMKALKNIDVAFVCMNLPYTMPPSEAAECIAAFSPKVVYPYHFRDSDPTEVTRALKGKPIEVRIRKWY